MTAADDDAHEPKRDPLSTCCAVALAVALTLAVRGYQFGQSNHTVYLIDALRANDPRLLANDWYVTHTFQYHVVFTRVTAWLDRVHALRPAFLVGYLALALLWHACWLMLARALGASRRAYLLSVVLYLLSAGGVGLGMYDFLQDAAFLPSNVANVAMLWGIYFWVTRRVEWAGVALGLAGFFHLNHAIVSVGLWAALIAWSVLGGSREGRRALVSGSNERVPSGLPLKGVIVGTIALLALCVPNMVPAARAALTPRPHLPLSQFIDLYVRLRHPHHYNPSSWPVALWVSFLWPFPLAMLSARRAPASVALRETKRIFLLFCALLTVALLFAGVWYVSESLVQMSLFRFSIYPKLLTCLGAAVWMCRRDAPWLTIIAGVVTAAFFAIHSRIGHPLPPLLIANLPVVGTLALLLLGAAVYEIAFAAGSRKARWVVLLPAIAMAGVAFSARAHHRRFYGVVAIADTSDRPDYLAVCDYAREHTPVDAVFLVPPSDQEFRLRGERAIVVNYKGVPQLSSELGEWRDRLCRVLDLPNLSGLPRRFDRTLRAIADRYDALSADQLLAAARAYEARYIVATRPIDLPPPARVVFEKGSYHLYDLAP